MVSRSVVSRKIVGSIPIGPANKESMVVALIVLAFLSPVIGGIIYGVFFATDKE